MSELAPSPLSQAHQARDAKLGEYHGAQVPLRFSDPRAEHRAVREAAGFFDFSFRARFAAKGADHVTFLHNMLSNDVKGLAPGRGAYATLLEVKGHILADLCVYRDPEQVLLETDADLRDKSMRTLDRYIIMDDVKLQRLEVFCVAFQGPKSSALLQKTLPGASTNLDQEYSHGLATLPGGEAVRVVRASSTGEEGYEVWAGAEAVARIWKAACDASGALGALPCGIEALESLRIEAGIPRYGAELDEDTLPLEAALLNALSFTKGCYIGQEVVERTRSRGHVNWKLAGLFVEAAAPPAPGEKVLSEGRPAGEITSSCISPTLERTLALGYVRREFSEPGTKLGLASGVLLEVASLPFYRHA
jgi:glycine cleavage system T protein